MQIRVQGSPFRVHRSGFTVQGSEFTVQRCGWGYIFHGFSLGFRMVEPQSYQGATKR
jgi:hypothetical protein